MAGCRRQCDDGAINCPKKSRGRVMPYRGTISFLSSILSPTPYTSSWDGDSIGDTGLWSIVVIFLVEYSILPLLNIFAELAPID